MWEFLVVLLSEVREAVAAAAIGMRQFRGGLCTGDKNSILFVVGGQGLWAYFSMVKT